MKHIKIISIIVIISISTFVYPITQSNIFIQIPDTTYREEQPSIPKKPWTFLVYMAARNDLHPFSKTNFRQMLDIGSTDYVNIIVNLDNNDNHGTQRFYMEKHNPVLLCQNSNAIDSGHPDSLIDFCQWGMTSFPADHYALILWDHGTGAIDPYIAYGINPESLFVFSDWCTKPSPNAPYIFTNPFQIKRKEYEEKGVCFDDVHKSYLTNYALEHALKTISEEVLNGEKISILGFDACLMADIAISNLSKNYVDIMVSSQNVELGPGWNYRLVLAPFRDKTMEPSEFAQHIVHSYEQAYHFIIGDYTQSAVNLNLIQALENNVNDVAILLIEALRNQKDKSVKDAIRISKSRRLCTAFDEPSYLDLHHLYLNFLKNIILFKLNNEHHSAILQETLNNKLCEGMVLIEQAVIANSVGSKLPHAKGISIYFPNTRIHSSYPKISFANDNAWLDFLKAYLTS